MARTVALPAKLTAPTLPLVLDRARLYRSLDRARKKPVIWIAGPPGAGKTTLAAGYLRARRLRPLWYNLDERDGDLATFFHYLGLAAQHVAPRFRRPLPHLTPEYALGLPTFTRNFFETLYSRLKPPAVLVFDNYHEIPAASPLHDMVQIGLGEMPKGVTVVVLSRQAPPPAFAGLEAAQRLEVIEPEALRLTERECDGIIRLHELKERWTLTKPLREELHRRVQGWVAGLILVLGQVKGWGKGAAPTSDQQPEVLFEYLASQSLAGLPSDTHTFLLKTAHLPVMTAAMAERLTGQATVGEMLMKLYRARYFIERRIEAQTWYQYHPLFREFLLARSHAVFPDDELKTLQRTAAALLADAGRMEDAIHLWQEAGETGEAVAHILTQAPTLVAQGRSQTLKGWMDNLPEGTIEQNPWLLFWLACASFPLGPKESRVLFERALRQFEIAMDQIGALLAWCGIIESIAYAWDEAIDVDERLAEFERFTQGRLEFPSVEIEARVASAMLNMLVWQRPDSALIHVWRERVLPRLGSLPDLNLLMQIGFPLLLHSLWTGQAGSARPLLAMFRHRLQSEQASPLARIALSLCEAAYAWTFGHPELTLDATTRGLHLAETTGVHVFTLWLMGQRVFANLVTWNVEGAQALLDKLHPQLDHRQDVFGAFYHYMAGKTSSFRGELSEALRHAEHSVNLCRRCGTVYTEALSRLDVARILYELGRKQEADRHLTWALELAGKVNGKLIELIVMVIRADVALQEGDEPAALEALRRGLAIGAATEFSYPTLSGPAAWARLCSKALEAGIEPAYVKKLIRIMRLAPEGPACQCEAWPWPVKMTTLGAFALTIDERPAPFSRKAPHRLLDLLLALVALGGQNIPVTRLIDTLWPEAEGDTGHDTFEKTLQRLRRLLGHDLAIQVKAGNLALNPQVCWVDAWALEQVAARVDTESTAGTPDLWGQLEAQALGLYRGPFLPDKVDVPWTEAFRDRLRRRFARLVERLTDQWCQAGQPQRGFDLLEKAIEADPAAEPLSRRLMNELAALGRRSEAIAVYHRCRQAVVDHFGAPPSADLERAYNALHKPAPR